MEDAPSDFTTELMKWLRKRQNRAIPAWYKGNAIRFLEEVIGGRHNAAQAQRDDAEKLLVKYQSK